MNVGEGRKRARNPREDANVLSLLSFSYTGGLFKKGYQRDLEDEDLYEVPKSCSAQRCGEKLEKQWKIEQKSGNASIYRLLWRRFGWRYIFVGCVDLIYKVVFSIFLPDATANLIAYFKPDQTDLSKQDAYFYAGEVISLILISCIYTHNYTLWIQGFAIEIRTAFSSLLYRKALRLTPSAMSRISLGNIVTLITKDVFTFQDSITIINDTWNGMVQTVIVCYLLYSRIGVVSFIGIGFLLIVMPIQMIVGKYVSTLRLAVGQKTDERLQVTQETLSTIRIIKMYTWEKFFGDKISSARYLEMSKILLGFYLRMVIILLGILFARLGFFALIISYIWIGYSTNTELVFYMLTIFKDLEYNLGTLIPYGMGKAAELYSSIVRIDRVISAEELTSRHVEQESSNPVIELERVTVHIKDYEILKNITFKSETGLTVITGTVGSGKSSLLKTMLNDCSLTEGTVISRGRISYASQDPWLFPSTIRQNILFGEQYNERRYQDIVKVCALQYDLNLYQKGDETIVTDRGLNLSKGQQARVNLARAIYKDSEIYLLDDSLAALDPQVQDYIFQECIRKYLKDKTVLLVSQTAHHIQEADKVVIMESGEIKSLGKPTEQILHQLGEAMMDDDDLDKEVIKEDEEMEEVMDEKLEKSALTGLQSDQTNVYGEIKKKGEVDYSTYKKYFNFGGGILLMLINGVIFALAQGTESYSDQLLTRWVDEKEDTLKIQRNLSHLAPNSSVENLTFNSSGETLTPSLTSSLKEAFDKENFTITLYCVMLFIATASALLKTYTLLSYCKTASVNIHKSMLSSIMTAKMAFFDTHFIGNILNRFSQDMNNIDEIIPFVFTELFRVLFSVSGIVFLIVSVHWVFLIYSLIFFVALVILRKLYMPTGRSLKRLEASTRSPMIGHLNASLEGITTIRAYQAQQILIEEFDRHQDVFTSAHYISLTTTRAFSFVMDFLCSIFISSVISKFTFVDTDTSVGDIGLAITQVFNLAGDVDWGIKQWADTENLMTSVERILEYTEIKSETKRGVQLENWPKKGSVTYENVSLSYNNKETVLKNLNFRLEAGQKLGIVGRTGAGKSSIIASIFRLYDSEGKILIDDVDINTLSLKFLREKLALIPQDPILFSGTIRTNLDPFGEFKDRELWKALERVKLIPVISSLDTETNSSNSTFSSGQKQLICLARAILRRARIVILDEATANMDQETDALLNDTVRENFSDCTMIAIAHRLHFILKCDLVMVLDKGSIRELDDPKKLLSNSKGHFYKMVQHAGLLNKLE